MKKIVVIALALVAISTVGCKKTVNTENELSLTFSGDIQGVALNEQSTRAMASKEGFAKGDSIGVFVVPWKNATTAGTLLGQGNYADNIPFIAGENPANFQPSATDKISFPNATTKINVYAFAMYHTRYNDLGATPTAYAWSVDKNQTTAVAVRKNDLMTADTANVAPTVKSIPLKFKHRFSKVEVLFSTPTTYKNEDVNGVYAVYIVGTRVKATVNLTDTTVVPVISTTATDTASINAYQALVKTTTDQASVKTSAYEYEAIVLPQDMVANSIVARVVLKVGTTNKLVTFDCASSTLLKYETGKKMQLKLTFEAENALNLAGVTIMPWGKTPDASAIAKAPSQVLVKITGNTTLAKTAKSAVMQIDGNQYSNVSVKVCNDTLRCSYLAVGGHHGSELKSIQFKTATGANVGTAFTGSWQIPGRPNDYVYNDVTTTLNF